MSGLYQFMGDHPIVTVLLAWCAAEVLTAPFKYGFKAYNRRCRSENIKAKGWPSNPNMDADGDLIYPKNS